MNIEANLLEKYFNFVDNTKKHIKYFKIFGNILCLFLFFVLFNHLNE